VVDRVIECHAVHDALIAGDDWPVLRRTFVEHVRVVVLTHGWLIGAAIVAIAGVYQFGSITYRCLDNAASITGHWRRLSARRASLLLGVNHGAFCIGCC
jgi:predicted metal-binding membrane protein